MKLEFLRFLHLYVPFQVSTRLMHCLHYLCGFLDFRGPFSFRAYLSHFQEPCKDYLKRVRATNWGLLSPFYRFSTLPLYIYVCTIQISKKENRFALIFTKFSSCKLYRSKRIPTYLCTSIFPLQYSIRKSLNIFFLDGTELRFALTSFQVKTIDTFFGYLLKVRFSKKATRFD